MIDIGSKLKQIRISHDLSQFELEIIADLAPGTVCRIEKGRVYPTLPTLFRIVRALNLNESEAHLIFCIDEIIANVAENR